MWVFFDGFIELHIDFLPASRCPTIAQAHRRIKPPLSDHMPFPAHEKQRIKQPLRGEWLRFVQTRLEENEDSIDNFRRGPRSLHYLDCRAEDEKNRRSKDPMRARKGENMLASTGSSGKQWPGQDRGSRSKLPVVERVTFCGSVAQRLLTPATNCDQHPRKRVDSECIQTVAPVKTECNKELLLSPCK